MRHRIMDQARRESRKIAYRNRKLPALKTRILAKSIRFNSQETLLAKALPAFLAGDEIVVQIATCVSCRTIEIYEYTP